MLPLVVLLPAEYFLSSEMKVCFSSVATKEPGDPILIVQWKTSISISFYMSIQGMANFYGN